MGLLIHIDDKDWDYSGYTIGALKAFIQDLLDEGDVTDDTLILMSSDGEGNSYSPWSQGYALGTYIPDSTWSGEFYNDADTEEDDETDDELGEGSWADDGVAAIVLYPIN